ncbi:hypothetical protein PVL30_001638 [Lodderomyces elongisporus]|uniref:uncharacterized protein n=1 Tax=Lodderomyces elongisporus TaxID=36914 RepID=UPI00291F74FF|nr:uncharacterized protein PVL30_001638 [Lodderomyces elongisporus]WLF77915.1 hypothetical protein PVL30_001638 [Lodderomyces elongisporus]
MLSSRTLVTCDSAMRQNGDQSEDLKSLQIIFTIVNYSLKEELLLIGELCEFSPMEHNASHGVETSTEDCTGIGGYPQLVQRSRKQTKQTTRVIGEVELHQIKTAEMVTTEGKTKLHLARKTI